MKKTIYLTIDETIADTGDTYQNHPTFDRNEALRDATWAWDHLTPTEQRKRHIYIGVYTVDVPADDTRTAAQIYDDMLDDCTWPSDHDVIELPKPSIMVENASGSRVDFAAAVALMDDEIREQLHAEGYDTEQEFFSAYEDAHEEKYGEPWALSLPNPVY